MLSLIDDVHISPQHLNVVVSTLHLELLTMELIDFIPRLLGCSHCCVPADDSRFLTFGSNYQLEGFLVHGITELVLAQGIEPCCTRLSAVPLHQIGRRALFGGSGGNRTRLTSA